MTSKRNITVQTPGNKPKPEQMPPQKEVDAVKESPEVGRTKEPEVILPTQAEVDAVELKRPVLTKDGWLVPASLGTPPNGNL